jgi:hypothetical protein
LKLAGEMRHSGPIGFTEATSSYLLVYL